VRIAAYEQIANSSAPEMLRELAVVKEAMLILAGTDDSAAIQSRLAPLAESGKPWYLEAIELQALFAHKKGDDARAVELFKKLTDDPKAPQGIRAIGAEMLAALGPVGTPAVAPSAPVSAAAPAADQPKQEMATMSPQAPR